jgi:hypothetical protein
MLNDLDLLKDNAINDGPLPKASAPLAVFFPLLRHNHFPFDHSPLRSQLVNALLPSPLSSGNLNGPKSCDSLTGWSISFC